VGHQIIRILFVLLCLVCAEAASAVELVLDQDYVHDSDGARQYAYAIGMDKRFARSPQAERVSMRVGRWMRHESGAASEDFNTLGVRYDSGDSKHVRTRLGLKKFMGSSWSPTVGDAMVSYDGMDRLYFEAAVQREMVESLPAIAEQDISQTWSVSADYKLTPTFTVVGALFRMDISDDNQRNGKIGRLIYSPSSLEGFNLQLSAKRIDTDFRSFAYFSPRELSEYELLASYKKSVTPDWVAGAKLGGGVQRVNSDNRQLVDAEVSLRGWFTPEFGLQGKLLCTNSGGFSVGQGKDGYRYCDANLSLIGVW
jgi:hypothetical protein